MLDIRWLSVNKVRRMGAGEIVWGGHHHINDSVSCEYR